MLSGIEAVIFDLDGTLIDSMDKLSHIDTKLFEKYGSERPKDLYKNGFKQTFNEIINDFIERYNLPGPVEKLGKEWIELAKEVYEKECELKKGTRNFIHRLKKKGIKLAIATNNSVEIGEFFAKVYDLDVFDIIKGRENVKNQKPAPDIYIEIAKELNVEPHKCLVFEDTPNGIRAGKAAKMKVCAVFDSYTVKVDEEKKKLSDFYVNSFDEVV